MVSSSPTPIISTPTVQFLEKNPENWQLGGGVEIIMKEEEDILKSEEDKVFTVLKKSFKNHSVTKEEKETTTKEK